MNATGIDTHLKKATPHIALQHSTAKSCCTKQAVWPSQVSQQSEWASSATSVLARWSYAYIPAVAPPAKKGVQKL